MNIQPCDQDIFENGETVFVTHTIDSKNIEKWVKKVAQLSGQRVDWHFSGGRAIVKTIEDISKVDSALKTLKLEHDELYIQAHWNYNKNATREELLYGCPTLDKFWK